MKTFILVFLIVFLVFSPVFARLNESLEKCISRYGAVVSLEQTENGDFYFFAKSGYILTITFFGKKADSIIYNKEKTDTYDSGEPFTAKEISTILRINTEYGEDDWIKDSESFSSIYYISKDQKYFAIYSKDSNSLHIGTVEYMNRISAEMERREEEALGGL